MDKKKEYTFLEWVFEGVGLAKFFLFAYLFGLLCASAVLTFIWWYTKR